MQEAAAGAARPAMEPAPIASGGEARPQADWREGRQDTLLSLARRPLDLWRPATPPEATEGPATVESSPLSLRYLAEAEMERWSERAFPAHDPRRDGSGAPLATAWRQGAWSPLATGPSFWAVALVIRSELPLHYGITKVPCNPP